MTPLSLRQSHLLRFIVEFTETHGYQPTLREMCEHLDLASTNAVSDHLGALELKGYIEREWAKSRRLIVLRDHRGRSGSFVWTPTEDTCRH